MKTMIDKKQAQETSLAKWRLLKNDFNELYERIQSECGYCIYCFKKRYSEKRNRCKICLIEFPAISKVCFEMLNFFSEAHNDIDVMIDVVIKVIKSQKVDEKDE